MLALVFPREKASLPYICPTVAARVLVSTCLEKIILTGWVTGDGRWVANQIANVDEMFLGAASLLNVGPAPL
jgi:hypothetical protein